MESLNQRVVLLDESKHLDRLLIKDGHDIFIRQMFLLLDTGASVFHGLTHILVGGDHLVKTLGSIAEHVFDLFACLQVANFDPFPVALLLHETCAVSTGEIDDFEDNFGSLSLGGDSLILFGCPFEKGSKVLSSAKIMF
jgi:hypothetical protein